MKESNFQTMFKNWIEENRNIVIDMGNMVYELKIEKTKSIRFDKVAEHQARALLQASGWEGGLYHKISDSPIYKGMKSRFTKPKPFDCFFLSDCKGYVVVWFYKPREKKVMYWIDVVTWLTLKTEFAAQGRKSIKEHELSNHVEYEFSFK